MKYNTVFIDLDDTIIDTYNNSKEALCEIYNKYEIHKHINNVDNFISLYNSVNKGLWGLYEKQKITKQELKELRFTLTLKDYTNIDNHKGLTINNDFMELVSNKNNLIEGAKDMLEYLKNRYKLVILSNGFKEVQDKKMKVAKVHTYFENVILSDDIGVNKPDPAIFKYALNITNSENIKTVMIGDNINTDIIGAKNCNIDQIWLNQNQISDINNIKPTHTITHLNQIKNIL